MINGKSRRWLVGLGLVLVVLGLVDAAGVVRARSAMQRDLLAETGGRVEAPLRLAQLGGFLPVQAQRATLSPERSSRALDDGFLGGEALAEEALPGVAEDVPAQNGEAPRLIWIPAIELYAPVVGVDLEVVEIEGVEYDQWTAPSERAAGWHASSALLAQAGNTVLNGHHNVYGEVFRDLEALQVGDEIVLYSDSAAYFFQVEERVIFPERFARLEQRLENASWVLPTEDERLTLITCWPYESNTHRLVLVARPVEASGE